MSAAVPLLRDDAEQIHELHDHRAHAVIVESDAGRPLVCGELEACLDAGPTPAKRYDQPTRPSGECLQA
jgi:hypothetical protein